MIFQTHRGHHREVNATHMRALKRMLITGLLFKLHHCLSPGSVTGNPNILYFYFGETLINR